MRELLMKVVSNLAAKGMSVILALGMHVFLARMLTVAEYGQFALLQVVTLGLATFAQAGMQNAYMKLVAELDDLKGLRQLSAFCFHIVVKYLAVSIGLYALLTFGLFLSGKVSNATVLIAFAIYLIAQTLMFLLLAWYRAMNTAYLASFLEQGSFAGLTIVFSLIWMATNQSALHVYSAAICYSAGAVCILVAFGIRPLLFIRQSTEGRDSTAPIDISRIKQLSHRFLTMQVAAYIASWSGLIIVGAILSAEQVAELNIAQRLAQVVAFFLIAFNGVVAPRFAVLNAKNDHEQLRLLAQRSSLFLALATLPVVLVTIIFGKYILTFFGPDYVSAYPILLIIMGGQFVNSMTGSVGFLLNMTNHEKIMCNIVIISGVFSIVFSVLNTMLFGVMGAAVTITLTTIITNLSAAYFVFKYLGFVTIPGLNWLK